MQTLKSIIVPGAITVIAICILFTLYIYVPKLLITSVNKFTVLMAGQSVTEQWFRRRELPVFINNLSIWRKWPIPYNEHVEGDIYYKRLGIPSPRKNKNKPGYEYGAETYKAIKAALNHRSYDALMFKHCFIDFGDRSLKRKEDIDKQFYEMTSLVKMVHGLAKEHKTKLILGNAMPSLEPGLYAQQLRQRYNQWIEEYVRKHGDVVKIELFNSLIDEEGKLKMNYSLDPDDHESHLNNKAYKILEKELSMALASLRDQ